MYCSRFAFNYTTTKLFWIILLMAGFSSSYAQNHRLNNLEVVQPVAMAISRPMRDLPVSAETEKSNWKDGIIPLMPPPNLNRDKVEFEKDGSLKEYPGLLSTSTITQNFDGVGALGLAPPDPSGDVGPNHYVQMVNTRTQIWNKSGISLLGPVNNSTFWAALGPPFSTTNSGDPIVLYDDMADRWMVSQFCLPNGLNPPYYELIAVSTTPDPTGTYIQYAYSFPALPDYPKFGVWPDGYYMSAGAFNSSSIFLGNYVVAFNRSAMLTGGVASMIYFLKTSTYALLPSDCDGVPPPSGTPNYFLTSYNWFGLNNTLFIYQFHVDFGTPANSTFTGPLSLATPVVNDLSSNITVPQLGTTNRLANLGSIPMNRLQYRNFGDHQAMVVCMTGNVGSDRAGIRWWELRKTSGDWSIFQEGTHAPTDALHRWMGSVAMDANGIIALGYSISGTTIKPGIRYTGRFPNDPPGVMTFAESEIQAGLGSQTGILYRWGDYTQMTVDPTDPYTFWYTNEYLPSDGTYNWKTKIAAFKYDIITLGIKVIPEGFYDDGLNRLNMKDTVKAYLKADDGNGFYLSIDSANAVIDSITFTGNFKFINAPSGTYYIVIRHRNSIETWSKVNGEALVKGSISAYDFTDAQNKAFGNNMILKGTKWCIYSGDVNQDGVVDLGDLISIDNDAYNFATGYLTTDLNGDSNVDLFDMIICDNNSYNFVGAITPMTKLNSRLNKILKQERTQK